MNIASQIYLQYSLKMYNNDQAIRFQAMITQHAFMFLSSFEKLRLT